MVVEHGGYDLAFLERFVLWVAYLLGLVFKTPVWA